MSQQSIRVVALHDAEVYMESSDPLCEAAKLQPRGILKSALCTWQSLALDFGSISPMNLFAAQIVASSNASPFVLLKVGNTAKRDICSVAWLRDVFAFVPLQPAVILETWP